jgi:hypothetical protein
MNKTKRESIELANKRLLKEDEGYCNEDIISSLHTVASIISGVIDMMEPLAKDEGLTVREVMTRHGFDINGELQELKSGLNKIDDTTCGKKELVELYQIIISKLV